MNIAVLGTGTVGRTIAGRLHELGHAVVIGTRDPHETLARTEPDAMGTAPFATWHSDHADVPLATYADAAAGAEIVVNASPGTAALEVLTLAGAENLAGKPLVDISNPLDFSQGSRPACSSRTPTRSASRCSGPTPTPRSSRPSTHSTPT